MKKLTLYISSFIFSWFILLLACSAQVPPINVDADGLALKGMIRLPISARAALSKDRKHFNMNGRELSGASPVRNISTYFGKTLKNMPRNTGATEPMP